MRRLALAVLSGALVLAACSDASRQGPSDTPAFDKGVPCPDTDFPLAQANALITQLYPAGTGGHGKHADDPRGDMLARAHDISEKWSKCKVADPQGKVVDFVADLLADFNAGNLIGGTSSETAALVGQLVNVMYAGVGFGSTFPAPPLPDVPTSGPDYGIGFFTPGTQLLVQTSSHNGAVLIPANGFTEPTTVTVYLRPNTPNPFDATGFLVYPPFYEITASNLSGTHYLANGQAVVGFCVDDTQVPSLTDPAIAHLAVSEGTNPGGFEILTDASDPQYESLGLDCERFAPPPPVVGSLFNKGVGGFFRQAPAVAAHYIRSAATALLLPTELHASVFFGKYGLGGLASSLSPFGVTDRGSVNHIQIEVDPSQDHYYAGSVVDTCHDGCVPEVELLDANDAGVTPGTNVTVSLLQVAGSGGVLTGTTTQPTDGNSTARFDDLRISAPGQYQLVFAAEGATPDTSATFDVYELRFIVQPTANANDQVASGALLGGSFQFYTFPAVVVAAFDFANDTVTTFNDQITITASDGTLEGDADTQLVDGKAVFTTMLDESSVQTQTGLDIFAGPDFLTGVTLRAHAFQDTDTILATSQPFNVEAAPIE